MTTLRINTSTTLTKMHSGFGLPGSFPRGFDFGIMKLALKWFSIHKKACLFNHDILVSSSPVLSKLAKFRVLNRQCGLQASSCQ